MVIQSYKVLKKTKKNKYSMIYNSNKLDYKVFFFYIILYIIYIQFRIIKTIVEFN